MDRTTSKAKIAREIECVGIYCRVRIANDGQITGMLVDQDYRYDPRTNTGGRRLIGYMSELARDMGV
jgi:hypothetical protein